MDPRVAATPAADPDAIEFVRFCHRRRRVGWPELYDEMCAVAARGLYRGYSAEDLGNHGIRFGLFDMPALAALTREVVTAELAARRPVQVAIHELSADVVDGLVEAAPIVEATTVRIAVAVTPGPVAETSPAAPGTTATTVALEPRTVERVSLDASVPEPRPVPHFRPVTAGA